MENVVTQVPRYTTSPKKAKTNIIMVRKKDKFPFLCYYFPRVFMRRASPEKRDEKSVITIQGEYGGGKNWILELRENKDKGKKWTKVLLVSLLYRSLDIWKQANA